MIVGRSNMSEPHRLSYYVVFLDRSKSAFDLGGAAGQQDHIDRGLDFFCRTNKDQDLTMECLS